MDEHELQVNHSSHVRTYNHNRLIISSQRTERVEMVLDRHKNVETQGAKETVRGMIVLYLSGYDPP